MARAKAKLVFDNSEVDEAAGIFKNEEGRRCVSIREFDMNNMHPWGVDDLQYGSKVVVIGKPGFGKSRIVQSIMLHKGHICPVAQVYSGTETVNHFYEKECGVTPITIFHELDTKAMEDFAKRQDIARKHLPVPWTIQVLDDVTDNDCFGKPPLSAYFKRGRHWAMIHIECIQYPMDVKPAMRSCVDYVFLLANGILSERQKLYENFGSGCIPTFQDFCDIMDGVTEDYTALVIDNTVQSNKMAERVFYYKADISRVPINWKYGCKDAWDFNDERLNPNFQPSII